MHHARLYIGTFADILNELAEHERRPAADVRHIVLDQFGVDDARGLTHEATLRPVEETHRTFVIAFTRATHEAQNALLKSLEEPPPTSRFCIIVPREDVLIPTVRSRLMRMSAGATASHHTVAEEFAASPYAERLTQIAEHAKHKDDAWMNELLNGLEVRATETGDRAAMQELVMVRSYFHTRGASKKMLLEHVALSLK